MLVSPFLEFVRKNAPIEGNFFLRLPKGYREILDHPAPPMEDAEGRAIVRDHILRNVVAPLIEAAESVTLYQTAFKPTSYNGEGATLDRILKKIGRDSYELKRDQDPFEGYLNFWEGVESDGSSRGYVLFMVGETKCDFERIFSFCYDPGVMAPSSMRSTLGPALYKKIIGSIAQKPGHTAIFLGDKGGLHNLTVFPGAAVFEQRLEQAIASTRTYDLRRVYGEA
jgi:hypothetical protein